MKLPLAREGFPFIAASLLATLALFALGWTPLALLSAVLSLFILNFFRDPERQPPPDPSAIVSAADGRVVRVAKIDGDRFLAGEATLVSVFMSPLDVHVNRLPISGRVIDVTYQPGRFLRAYADDASLQNESTAVLAEDDQGRRMCFVQVAGFVARRILCYLTPGMEIRRGERYGMIRFGSRADHYLPPGAEVAVAVGDRTVAGETVIARWK